MDGNLITMVRVASPADARTMAKLIDIAGEGIPHWLWSGMAEPGQSPLDVGEARARRESGGFSYRNALVAEQHGEVAGIMLGYRIEAPSDDERTAVARLPEPIRPFASLEHESVGSFYVNALAVLPGRRGAGLGSLLLETAEAQARTQGIGQMSIQVYEQNSGALRLYQRCGYRQTASRPVLWHPGQPYYDGRVLLLLKDL